MSADGKSIVNSLSVFGIFAVTAMVVCYALENRSHWFVLGFAFLSRIVNNI